MYKRLRHLYLELVYLHRLWKYPYDPHEAPQLQDWEKRWLDKWRTGAGYKKGGQKIK